MRTHGTVGTYQAGCRCDDCRTASTAAQRRRRQRQRYELAKLRDTYAPIRRGPYGSSLPGLDDQTPHFPQASCARVPTDHRSRWFSGDRVEREAAKTICRGCPEQLPCLTWALNHPEVGIWGGLTEDERERARTRREVAS